jgi:hypothetical protein
MANGQFFVLSLQIHHTDLHAAHRVPRVNNLVPRQHIVGRECAEDAKTETLQKIAT